MSMFFRKRTQSSATQSSRQSMTSVAGGGNTEEMPPQPEVLGGADHQRERRGTMQSVSALGFSTGPTPMGRERSTSESLVRSGYLMKKGVINQAYKKRWFVLTTRTLFYFDDKPGENDIPKGSITLSMVSKVDVKADDSRERFNVYTPTRIYRLRAESVAESEAWIAAVSGAVEMEKKTHSSRPRRPSLSPLEELKLEGSNFAANARIHAPAELNKWENWNAFEVAAFLGTFGMNLNGVKFFNYGVTGARLRELSSTDLERMGITKKEDQVTILNRINHLVKGEIQG